MRSLSRPVCGVNWFEARAYSRWLTAKLQPSLTGDIEGYVACLPIEWQWERVARCVRDDAAKDHQYPCGAAETNLQHFANIASSGIGSSCVVGCFAPNALGIYDLNGNLREWQDNLYSPEALHLSCRRIARIKAEATSTEPGKDWLKTLDKFSKFYWGPALRGGAWDAPAVNARASFRFGFPAVFAIETVGFRVVLSQPN